MISGIKLAAIYGFPPSKLGFCGPGSDGNLSTLVNFIGGDDFLAGKARDILSRFKAAYGYYQLIARVNGITDPFNQKVIEAYWLGNELLEKVKLPDLKRLILTDFCRPGLLSSKEAKAKVAAIPSRAKLHHSFHVLMVGSVTGKVKFTTKVRDVCRIGWGKVIKVKSEKLCRQSRACSTKSAKIKSRPLKYKDGRYFLDKTVEKIIDWDPIFLPKVKVEDKVSFHWNRACQVISERQQKNLEKYTQINIEAFSGRRR